MLPSSVRRVVSAAAPQAPILANVGAGRATVATKPFLLASHSTARHQRRYSSSTSSPPDNDPKNLPSSDRSLPAQSSKSSSSSGEKRRRRTKEPSSSAAFKGLPSVPSTQHLAPEALAISFFFSQHRPISITHSLPRVVSDDAFASIFLRRSRAEKTRDVISTLSQTVQDLEQPMSALGLSGDQQQADSGDMVREITIKNADGTDMAVCIQLNDMVDFKPFCPPPAPEPKSAAESEADQSADAARQEGTLEPQRRVYKAILTIEETIDENGEVKYTTHGSQLIEEPAAGEEAAPPTFLERMALRQLRFEDSQRDRKIMQAISVKRQRKLKMKKKKYKKLMKRTRNERRKLHRL